MIFVQVKYFQTSLFLHLFCRWIFEKSLCIMLTVKWFTDIKLFMQQRAILLPSVITIGAQLDVDLTKLAVSHLNINR